MQNHLREAQRLLLARDGPAALEAANRGIAANPEHAAGYLMRGFVHAVLFPWSLELWEAVQRDAQRAADQQPRHPFPRALLALAHYRLGCLRAGEGDLDTAHADFQAAHALDPSYPLPVALEELRTAGAFGFPQATAQVLVDTSELRLSACVREEHLFVQAVLWSDHEDSPREKVLSGSRGESLRQLGDRAELYVDAGNDGHGPGDRIYHLSPWRHLPGMHYVIRRPDQRPGEERTSALTSDSQGRGAVRFVLCDSILIRVDTFLIPLAELSSAAKPAEIGLRYLAKSEQPERVRSSGASLQPVTASSTGPLEASLAPKGRF